MNEVISPNPVTNAEMKAEVKSWIDPVSDAEERKRQDEFEEKFRQMQRDYRGENDLGTKPIIFPKVSKWKFWRFWK